MQPSPRLRAWHNTADDDHTPLLLCAIEAQFLNSEYKTSQRALQVKKCHQISPNASLAVLAAEDQKFLDHNGFDYEAINEAWQKNQHNQKVRGASTISQQVAKNLYLWPGKSFFRKGLEAYFTLLIEILWPKQRIMEVYLNIAEFGDDIYGVEAAGKKFFKHPAKRLTKFECALLAAVLPSPIRLKVDRPSFYVLKRQTWILREMYQLNGLEQDPSLQNK